MGLKDLCWCTNSHHPCGPSTTVSTQLICTNLEHKPLTLFRLTAIHCHSTGKMVKNKDAIVNSNTIQSFRQREINVNLFARLRHLSVRKDVEMAARTGSEQVELPRERK